MAALEYVFPLALTEAWKEEIKAQTRVKLEEMLGVEVDNVMAEYVIVMVGNKKNMAQIAHDLVDFIGDESAQQFVTWFGQLLASFEAQASAQTPTQAPASPAQAPQPDQPNEQQTEENAESKPQDAPTAPNTTTSPPKRIVSLKSVPAASSSSSSSGPKKVVSLSGSSRGTIRSLNPGAKDMDDVLARRSQRFGAVDKSALASGRKTPPPSTQKEPRERQGRPSREEPRERGSSKRRANDRDAAGSKLTQRLGPPVNVDQAELDARDSLQGPKKRRGDDRDQQHKKKRRGDSRDRDHDVEDSGGRHGKRRTGGDSREVAPPLPPSDNRNFGRDGPRGMGPPMDFQGPPGYGGYPPYGAPMFYPPPGYGMPPYGMGFPPQGMPPQYGGRSYPRPPGGHMGAGGPRGFQNRTWVNPNVAKAEEAKASKAAKGETADGAGASANAGKAGDVGLNPGAPAFAPRNPYFGSSQMRPRFQNKTWVRPEPAKDAELDSSLPKTPPKELEDME